MTTADITKLILMTGAVGISIVLARWGSGYVLDLLDQFRGGPKPPSQPLPNDNALLLKRRAVRQ